MDPDRILREYDYELPAERIAQVPPPRRRDARLLIWPRGGGVQDATIDELERLLRPGDLLVLNDTRVFPARLYGVKEGGGARVELLLVDPLPDGRWSAMARPGRRLAPGSAVRLDGGAVVELQEPLGQGLRAVGFPDGLEVLAYAEAHGHVPLPPYIDRPDRPEDRERYQTLFAREPGSVAAPTAGLHLDARFLEERRERGERSAWLTLHVGPGTFRPLDEEDLQRGRLHAERYHAPRETLEELRAARERGDRIVAVGTTACRTLESLDLSRIESQSGSTSLFIRPGHRFQAVDVLLTNFHLPRSSLLMLVSAFAGERWRAAYEHAVAAGYRFYSYGDANWIEREEGQP